MEVGDLTDLAGTTVLLLVLAAFAAGWVDAVVGGGGLVQLPALLLVPGLAPVQALATNKLASIMGTSVSVGAWTVARPAAGLATDLRFSGHRHYGTAAAIGLAIGFYDGLVGPGTGSFLVIALVAVLGYAFLEASAKAKIVNAATNLGALVVFAVAGAPVWRLGLLMGAANIAGAYLGARMAVARGSRFVRVVFLVVVGALVVRLAWDVLTR